MPTTYSFKLYIEHTKSKVADVCASCAKNANYMTTSKLYCINCGVVSFSTNELEIWNTDGIPYI